MPSSMRLYTAYFLVDEAVLNILNSSHTVVQEKLNYENDISIITVKKNLFAFCLQKRALCVSLHSSSRIERKVRSKEEITFGK